MPLRDMEYKEAAAEALLMAMEKYDKVFLMGEGVDNITGVYGHVFPAYEKFGPARVIDTPLSENGLTGFAIGAALDGMRPVLIHQRNDFMLLAMDQMMNQAAKFRYASGGRHKVPVVFLSFIARKPGEGVQHSQSLQSVFAHFPGIKVGMPATPFDAKGMILAAIEDDGPVIILEHRSLFGKIQLVPEEYYKTPYEAQLLQAGEKLTIVALSAALESAIEAANLLENNKGVVADIINLRWVRPLDCGSVIKSVRKTGRLLVADTGWTMFGVGSEIVARVCESLGNLKSRPVRIGLPDIPCPSSHYLEKHYHPNAEDIFSAACKMF